MSKPSVRRSILVSSVRKLVDPDERVDTVVMLWTRHRWFVPYCLFAGLALFGIAVASGIDAALSQVVVAACGVAVAGMATTNYWVLAATDQGLVLCRSSRIRQYATRLEARLPATTKLEMVASTVITSDWRIGPTIYTLTKRWEPAMRQLAMEPPGKS